MNVSNTSLPGVVLIEPRVFADARGFFLETWQHARYEEHGLPTRFVQDNLSSFVRGTLRGLHFQHPQWSSRFRRGFFRVRAAHRVALASRVTPPDEHRSSSDLL
jgi:dTDP-4-dehydrorhamnose 3,5-epimerase-like enzyme